MNLDIRPQHASTLRFGSNEPVYSSDSDFSLSLRRSEEGSGDEIDISALKSANDALLASAKEEAQALANKARQEKQIRLAKEFELQQAKRKDFLLNNFLGEDFGNGVTGYPVLATLVALEEKEAGGFLNTVKRYGRLFKFAYPKRIPDKLVVKTTFQKSQKTNVHQALSALNRNKITEGETRGSRLIPDRDFLRDILKEFKAQQAEKGSAS